MTFIGIVCCAVALIRVSFLRYESTITFDPLPVSFKCPRCMGTCNCTSCCAKRGETYVSSRGKKFDVPFSDLYTHVPKRQKRDEPVDPEPKPRPSRSTSRPARQVRVDPPKTKVHFELTEEERKISAAMALPTGAVWGTIYGLKMDRIGIGVVTDDASQNIVVRQDPSLSYTPYEEASDEGDEDESEEESSDEEDGRSVLGPTQSVQERTLSPSPLPRRGLFIGAPSLAWKVHDATAMIPPPAGHAYIGKKESIRHSPDPAPPATYWPCMEGPLTPEPEDVEDEVPLNHTETSSPSQAKAGEVLPEEFLFVIAQAINNMNQKTGSVALVQETPAPIQTDMAQDDVEMDVFDCALEYPELPCDAPIVDKAPSPALSYPSDPEESPAPTSK